MLVEFAEVKGEYLQNHGMSGKRLTFGCHEDSTSLPKVARHARYQTPKSGDERVSFKTHVYRVKDGQNDIYSIARESIAAASSSPSPAILWLEGTAMRCVAQPIDEYAVDSSQKQTVRRGRWRALA